MLYNMALLIMSFLLFSIISCGSHLEKPSNKPKKSSTETIQEQEKSVEIVSSILGKEFLFVVGKEAIGQVFKESDSSELESINRLKASKKALDDALIRNKDKMDDSLVKTDIDETVALARDAYDKTYALAVAIAALEKNSQNDDTVKAKIVKAKESLETAVEATQKALSKAQSSTAYTGKKPNGKSRGTTQIEIITKKRVEEFKVQSDTAAEAGLAILGINPVNVKED